MQASGHAGILTCARNVPHMDGRPRWSTSTALRSSGREIRCLVGLLVGRSAHVAPLENTHTGVSFPAYLLVALPPEEFLAFFGRGHTQMQPRTLPSVPADLADLGMVPGLVCRAWVRGTSQVVWRGTMIVAQPCPTSGASRICHGVSRAVVGDAGGFCVI